MDIRELVVINQRKDEIPLSISPSIIEDRRIHLDLSQAHFTSALSTAFFLDTCIRKVWVTQINTVLEKRLREGAFTEDRSISVYRGLEAYQFLLQVGAGLESAIPGETDVFGQLKEAWKNIEKNLEREMTSTLKELRPWMQRLFEDVKEIRSRFLQGVGGASYGSLARMMLGREPRGPLLLVGAGKMARSIFPYLADSEVWIWNRSPERTEELLKKHQSLNFRQPVKIVQNDFSAELQAWEVASDVVLCVPADPSNDEKRVAAWLARKPSQTRLKNGIVIHLGILDAKGTPWEKLPELRTLTDLFQIQRTQDRARQQQVDAALRACHEKATLRALGGSISLAHGWEDLAVFTPLAVE